MAENKSKQKRALPHTRAIQRDRSKRPNGAPPAAEIEQWLEEAIQPAIYNQMALYRQMGLRQRVLTLPVMVAFVLSLVWRQMGSVREAVRVLREEGMLWVTALEQVTPQAMLDRLGGLPASLFHNVLMEVMPAMQARALARQRPVPPAVAWAQRHFRHIWAVDGSVLDTLLKKVGLLHGAAGVVLAGKIAALVDIVTQAPVAIWYDEDSQSHDQRFWPRLLARLVARTLLLFDRGWLDYEQFDRLTERQVGFITCAKSNTTYTVVRVLSQTATVHDLVIRLGSRQKQCQSEMRLVQVLFRGKWYRYLTNVLDSEQLPAACVVALYDQRWRLEEAFHVVKRLLGLAYFYSGSVNAVQLQLWATWLLYAMLVDLTDSVAEGLRRPFRDISIEMVFRGLYHFTQARQRGLAQDPVEYLVRKAEDLSLIKQKRPKEHLSLITQMNLTIPKLA